MLLSPLPQEMKKEKLYIYIYIYGRGHCLYMVIQQKIRRFLKICDIWGRHTFNTIVRRALMEYQDSHWATRSLPLGQQKTHTGTTRSFPLSYQKFTTGLPEASHWATRSLTHWATRRFTLEHQKTPTGLPQDSHWNTRSLPLGYQKTHIGTPELPVGYQNHIGTPAPEVFHWATRRLPLPLAYRKSHTGLPKDSHWNTRNITRSCNMFRISLMHLFSLLSYIRSSCTTRTS